MAEVNQKIVHCSCLACYETGRAKDAPFGQTAALSCIFAKSWEEILTMYSISFRYHELPQDEDEVQFMRNITYRATGPRLMYEANIINVGHDNLWRNVALGRDLARNDILPFSEPRNKLRLLFK